MQIPRANMGILPDDVILSNILTRLPVKSLYRFSCVCKLWCYTIHHDQKFLDSHFNHAKANPSVLAIFQYLETKDRLCQFMFLDFNTNTITKAEDRTLLFLDFVGSCDGLICFLHSAIGRYKIYNPSTQEVLILPSLISDQPTTFGFGFDPLKGKYKILIGERYDCTSIYTLGEDSSWRNITSTCNFHRFLLCKRRRFERWSYAEQVPVLVNGTLYWLDHDDDKILLFDLHHEVFQVISAPIIECHSSSCCSVAKLTTDTPCCRCLFEFGGHLCLAHFSYRSDDEAEMDIYVLNDLNSWAKEKQSIILQLSQLNSSPKRSLRFSMLGFPAKQQVLLNYWMTTGNFRLYNAYTWSVKELEFLLMKVSSRYNYDVINHVENFLSLKTLLPPGEGEGNISYMSSRREAMSSLAPRFVDVTNHLQ